MRINLKVPDEWNDERKKLKATWRTVVKAGLAALQNRPIPESGIPPAVEGHLKKGLDGLSEAWKLIKPLIKR